MDKEEVTNKIIDMLESYDLEEIMKTLLTCQIHFITDNISSDDQLGYTNHLANLLVGAFLEFTEETNHGTSQAKH